MTASIVSTLLQRFSKEGPAAELYQRVKRFSRSAPTWASAENYRVLQAEVETPENAAVAYRDFVPAAVRRSVLDWQVFRADLLMDMAAEIGIPDADREQVIDYIGREFQGLHEGKAIACVPRTWPKSRPAKSRDLGATEAKDPKNRAETR